MLGSQSHPQQLVLRWEGTEVALELGHSRVPEPATSELGSRLDAMPKNRQTPVITWLLTDLSRTVGIKSCPMPSTSIVVVFVLFISLGRATMEPSGSTPMIFEGRKIY